MYRYDTVFAGAGNRGTDAVTLLVAVPLLVIAVLGYRRGSLRWRLMLTGVLAWLVYVYPTMTVGAAFNPQFAVYVAVLSASLCAFVIGVKVKPTPGEILGPLAGFPDPGRRGDRGTGGDPARGAGTHDAGAMNTTRVPFPGRCGLLPPAHDDPLR